MSIPNAKDFLFNNYDVDSDDVLYICINAMVDFAKLHVKAALEKASNDSSLLYIDGNFQEIIKEYNGNEGLNEDPIKVIIDKKSILNAYPESNIK